jgi:histidine triad (HIT) family protein
MTCAVCEKIKEKKALIVYEDDNLIAVLPSKPAVPGHVKIMPKQHFTKLEEMDDELVEQLFFLSNIASSAVFEALRAHGTNIMLNESDAHLAVDVIPRKEGDGLNFLWKPKQLTPAEMDDIHNKINDKIFLIAKKEEEKEAKLTPAPALITEEKKEEIIKLPKEDKINYLIKHLTKIP